MKQEKVVRTIVDLMKRHCDADDYALRLHFGDSIETRFAQNRITQHIGGSSASLSMEVIYGARKGSASTNQLDNDSVMRALDNAKMIARFSEPDPEYVAYPGYAELKKFQNSFDSTASLKVRDLVDVVSQCIDNAKKQEAMVSGMTERHLGQSYLFTKKGFIGHSSDTMFEHSMTIKKEERETRVAKSVLNYQDFKLSDELKQLNSQLKHLTSPATMEAGKINVILRPTAVIDLFSFMLWGFDRRDADDGLTPFSGQLDQPMFGKEFTLTTETGLKGLLSPAYTYDGMPTKSVTWAKKGILTNMPTSRYYAQLKGLEPVTNPFNFHIQGGSATEEEMMKKAGNGIIINRFWYIRVVDRKRGELTGMTRDGVLYFEKGKIKHAVNNFRFNEIPHEVTRRILALGPSILQDVRAKVPTMLVSDFNFVDRTSF